MFFPPFSDTHDIQAQAVLMVSLMCMLIQDLMKQARYCTVNAQHNIPRYVSNRW